MPGFTDFVKNNWLDALLRNESFANAAVWVSLHTGSPGSTGANEVDGGGYARQSATFAAASAGEAVTTNAQSYTNLPTGTYTHVGLWDSETGGQFLGGGALETSREVVAGDDGEIAAGDLSVDVNQ